jgi:hypothetical protein
MPFRPLRLCLRRAQFLPALGLAAIVTTIVSLPSGSLAFLFALMLLGALGARREFQTPSLKELAFFSMAIIAAALIRPGAHLAASAYEAAGFVTLAVFMAFVLALAIALGMLAGRLLTTGEDGA